ncbi:DoxX family protein [Streptomyces sp. ActVer]|uniref:DoxX family protein n=1 Tax=Streptomyces sp. ActVer TaxID=3014558 RepID=UPI0022B43CBD|nr:DoxX family protein [Streptomyces sp. ActVer]MCZ4508447.1 DoxX family protein [Streptomyces sp. ActVer]
MGAVRAIGAIEILGAAGLVLPPLTGTAPALAMFAALGFLVLPILATVLHLSRGEVKETGLNVVRNPDRSLSVFPRRAAVLHQGGSGHDWKEASETHSDL